MYFVEAMEKLKERATEESRKEGMKRKTPEQKKATSMLFSSLPTLKTKT